MASSYVVLKYFEDMSSGQPFVSDVESPVIGVVGSGQLAQMLVEAASLRNVRVSVQAVSTEDPASKGATRVVIGSPTDINATEELIGGCVGVTFENEWVDVEALAPLEEQGVSFVPPLAVLDPLVNKLKQRKLLNSLGIACPDWILLDSIDPIQLALPNQWDFPVMAKAISGGYDGKGTKVIRSKEELLILYKTVDPSLWILEAWVNYDNELALVVSRDSEGKLRSYPLVETHQHNQICNWVLAPAGVSQDVEATAYNVAASLLTKLSYVGVLAIEFFYGPKGLLVNEIAPRTHNSGHFSIEACRSSQFDQQLCISAGIPVPSIEFMVDGALMANLLGLPESSPQLLLQRLDALRQCDGFHVHWYEKSSEQPGRKMGHVTVLLHGRDIASRNDEAQVVLQKIRAIWPMPQMEMP